METQQQKKRKFYNFFFLEEKNIFLFNWIFVVSCLVFSFVFYMIGLMISQYEGYLFEANALLACYIAIVGLPMILVSINNLIWFKNISKDYRALMLTSPILNIILWIVGLVLFIFGRDNPIVFVVSLIFGIVVMIGLIYLIYSNSYIWRKIRNDRENTLR